MTKEELDQLEQLARAATPGPWRGTAAWSERTDGLDYYAVVSPTGNVTEWTTSANAKYIAAASPGVVLGLIARIRELEAIAADVDRAIEAVREQAFAVGQRQARLTLLGDPPQVE